MLKSINTSEGLWFVICVVCAVSCNEFGLRDRAIVQAIIKSLVESAPQAALASSFFTKAKQQKRFKGKPLPMGFGFLRIKSWDLCVQSHRV